MAPKKELQCTGCEQWIKTRRSVVPDHQNKSGTGKCTGSGRDPKNTRIT